MIQLVSKNSETKYQYLFDCNPQPMWVYDIETLEFLDVNNATLLQYGYTKDEFLSMTMKDIGPSEDVGTLLKDISIITEPLNNSGIWRHKKKDGEIIYVQINSHLIEFEGRNARLLLANDVTESKLAREELELAYGHLNNLYNNLPEAVFSFDMIRGRMLQVSKSHEEIFGYPPEEFFSNSQLWYEIVLPEDRHIIDEGFSVLSSGSVRVIQYRILRPDGEIRWVEARIKPIIDENSKLIRVDGIASDITHRKIAEEELKISKSKYQNLFDNANDAILIFEPETEIVLEVNNKACEMYNITKEKFIGLSLKSITRNLKVGQKKISETMQNKSYRNFESQQFTSDGICLDLLINASVIEYNGKQAILSINRDITERKRIDENIKLLSKSVDQSQVSVVISDPVGTIQYINPKFTTLTGYTYEEVIDKGINILQPDFHPPVYYENIWDNILSGKDWHGELYIRKKNGEFYWENAVISPILNDEDKITNIVAVKEDITEKKKMIEEMISAKEKAEEASRLKSSFLANMSHELRTPLIGILGFAELLALEISDCEQVEMTNNILKSGKRLMETLNSILDISRIEANKHDLTPEPVDLNVILTETVNLFKPVAKEKGLSLNLIVMDNIPVINSDKDLLLKIFNNLISNAVKYTEVGGVSVRLSTNHSQSNSYLTVNVIDSGIGISKEHQGVIFEPFRQVSEGFSRRFDGTGLGLSITKKFIEMLNGSISVESTQNKGSTFKVNLPLPDHEINLGTSENNTNAY